MWSFIDFALNTLILNVVLLHSFLFLYYWFCLSTSSTITLSYKFKNGLPLEGLNFVSGTSIILNFETNLAKNIFISVIANLCPIQTRWPDPKGLQVNSTILSAFSFKNRSGWNELGSGKNSSSEKWGRNYKSWFANFFSLILPLKKAKGIVSLTKIYPSNSSALVKNMEELKFTYNLAVKFVLYIFLVNTQRFDNNSTCLTYSNLFICNEIK